MMVGTKYTLLPPTLTSTAVLAAGFHATTHISSGDCDVLLETNTFKFCFRSISIFRNDIFFSPNLISPGA